MAGGSRKKGMPIETRVPLIGYPVHENINTLSGQRLLSIIRFKGVSYSTKEKSVLDKWFYEENRFFTALGKKEGKNLMMQSYTTKSSISLDATYEMELPVLQALVDEYTMPFRNGKYLQVGYSLALILKYKTLDEGISRMKNILTMAKKMLGVFEPSILGVEENEFGTIHSQVGRYLSLLFNGYEQNILLSDTRLGDAVIDSITNFAPYDYVEIRPNRGGVRYASTYDLRDYPDKSKPGMWDEAIEEQIEFTLIQTFIFEDRNKAKGQFNKQTVDLESAEGKSKQSKELAEAVQQIAQGEKVFGRYHASLIVYGDTPEEAVENGDTLEAIFTARDTRFVRSTVTNDDTYLSLFPGCTIALYPVPKSTENFACGFSLHASPTGKAVGNPPGDGKAWMPFATEKDAIYFYNAHNSPVGVDNTGEALAGHGSIVGQTSAGKTTLEAAEILFASRWNSMYFCLDYNHSLENLLRALNTHYFTVSPGDSTGINLFQMEDTNELRQTLFDNTVTMAGGRDITSDDELNKIQSAIAAVMKHSVISNRGMSLLLQFIPKTGDNCLHTRLAKWCRVRPDNTEGQYAWVCDAPENKFDPKKHTRLAFDCTAIMNKEFFAKNRELMEVFLNSMFYLKKLMQRENKGRMLIDIIAECWVPLSIGSASETIKEILKAGRTRYETLIMDTQSPEDLSKSEHGPAVIQQVITQTWLANERADEEEYAKFNIRGKEFEIVRAINPLSREFLVKQGQQSVKLKFELTGRLKYWLPLLSSSDKNLPVAERIRQELNTEDPSIWVPAFLDEMARIEQQEKGQI